VGEDEDVINVDKDEPVQHVTENIIHQSLEHCRGVGEAKRPDQVFVVALAVLKAVFHSFPSRIRTRW
jgi:hypothetical protein